MKRIKIFTLLISLSVLFGIWSCSVEDQNAQVNSAISPLYPVTLDLISKISNQTRSVDSNSTDAGLSTEWIKSWALLILDNSTKTVEKIIVRPSSNTSLIQSETSSVNLSSGAKTIFALANITASQAGISYTEGTVLSASDIASLKSLSYNSSTGNNFQINALSDSYIPMSNIVNITVSKAQQQHFDIPLYRMLAKLEFDFTSDASEDVTVTNIKMSPITADYIFLFPEYVNISGDRTDYSMVPLFPTNSTASEFDYKWVSGNVVPAGTSTVVPTSFYINESKGSSYSQHLVFTLTTTRGGKASEENYTLTNLSFINRNDNIKIPVVLTDYIFDPSIEYYPPIGGYPDVRMSDDKSYFIFYSGGGEFVLTPNLRKSNSTTLISPKDITLTIDSGASIFNTNPVFDPVEGVIKGELNGTTGTAVITLSMNVVTGSSSVERTLTRKIYLIVE